MNQDQIKQLEDKFNELLSGVFKTPRLRYFRDDKKNMFFWTTEKVHHNSKDRYLSGIYIYLKTKNNWKSSKVIGHVKRKDAKARALRLFEK